jgi:hypothetical protein
MNHIGFGKYRETSPALLLIKDPDYAVWMLTQTEANGRLAEVQPVLRTKIRRFDEKPLIESCVDCGEPATCCSVYKGTIAPRWCCDDCDPAAGGATAKKLRIIRTYADAVRHVRESCGGRKEDLRLLIRSLAQAKGLPQRVGEEQAAAFFR